MLRITKGGASPQDQVVEAGTPPRDPIGETGGSPDPIEGPIRGVALGRLIERIKRFAQENGQTLVEYGIIVMLLAIAVVAILTVVGEDVVNLFTGVSSDFQEIESRTP